jgi:hypothetical protein
MSIFFHNEFFKKKLHFLEPPQIQWRRASLPAFAPDTSNIGLWNIMRKAIGKDLSRVAMPVILNEPLGLLQKLCEEMEYSDLLDRASQTDDGYLRLVYIVAFIVSTYSSNYYRTGRKNFNPLLGETYECIREDKGWKFLAEQVIVLFKKIFFFEIFFFRLVIIHQLVFVLVFHQILYFLKVRK